MSNELDLDDCAAVSKKAMRELQLRKIECSMWHRIICAYMTCNGDAKKVMATVRECKQIALDMTAKVMEGDK
jgi:hypothetical protein